jgi:hypothetical protein
MARQRNVRLRDLGLAELDELWDAAKIEERAAAAARQATDAKPGSAGHASQTAGSTSANLAAGQGDDEAPRRPGDRSERT